MADGGSTATLAPGAFKAAFMSRDFRLYQAARLMVIVGAEAQSVAVAWQVYAITHSALALGYTGLALFLPGIFFMLAAGHVADRYDRRWIILSCYGLQAVCTAGLLVLSMNRQFMASGRVWPIYAILIGIGLGRCFSGPAASAMLPSLVPKEHFVNAVTWGATVFQIANMSGPAVGGLLFTLPLTGALEHWNGASIVYAFTLVMLLGFIVLVGLIRTRVAQAGKKEFSAKTMLVKPIKRRAGVTMLTCVGIFGAATVVFGLSTHIWLSMVALVIVGASDMVSVVVRSSILQLATPPEMRGRVSAVNWLFIGASNEFGEFESGLTAQWWGAVKAVVIGGVASMVVTASAAGLFPKLRDADALTAESLMEAERELSDAEPVG